jgi:hypothetical protein
MLGAGKTHTINKLHESGHFPLESFVTVDPDEIRRRLPEFQSYIQHNPERAGELTRKEAGMIAEILTNSALEQGMNVLVDGSLKDAAWHGKSGWKALTICLASFSPTNRTNACILLGFFKANILPFSPIPLQSKRTVFMACNT